MPETPSDSSFSPIGEDGKPAQWNIDRFHRNIDLFVRDTMPKTLERLKPQLDRIERFFEDGNIKALLEVMAQSAPFAYHEFHDSLVDAQVINDWSGVALACLIGEDRVRSLRFQYRSVYGQDSADVERERMMGLAGLRGEEAQAAALTHFHRENPGENGELERQQQQIRSVLQGLSEKK